MIVSWRAVINTDKDNAFCNGGWVKNLTKIDPDKTGGYAYIGPFISNAKDGLTDCPDGLYIVCSVEGSQNSLLKRVAFFRIQGDEVTQVSEWITGNDWSLKLRPRAQELLNLKVNPLEKFATEALVAELKSRGVTMSLKDKMSYAKKQSEVIQNF